MYNEKKNCSFINGSYLICGSMRLQCAGNDYPAEVVRAKLLKLNGEHIRFVMDCLKQNTTRIRNIRQYLLTVLFNAPSTMSGYYTALVAHDMAA